MIAGLPTLLFGRRAVFRWRESGAVLRSGCCGRICGTLAPNYRGVENIPKGACIVAPKHQSFWETFALVLYFDDFSYVLKRELTYIPFFGWYLLRAEQIAIDRANGRTALRQLTAKAKALFAQGRQLFIFPEGDAPRARRAARLQAGVAYIYDRDRRALPAGRPQCRPVLAAPAVPAFPRNDRRRIPAGDRAGHATRRVPDELETPHRDCDRSTCRGRRRTDNGRRISASAGRVIPSDRVKRPHGTERGRACSLSALARTKSVTIPQIEIFVIVAIMLTLFMWDRLRHDLVACLALLATIVVGHHAGAESLFRLFQSGHHPDRHDAGPWPRDRQFRASSAAFLRAFLKRAAARRRMQIGTLTFGVTAALGVHEECRRARHFHPAVARGGAAHQAAARRSI